jgi:hypothetical protein
MVAGMECKDSRVDAWAFRGAGESRTAADGVGSVVDAGFANRTTLEILIGVKLAMAHDVDETDDDEPLLLFRSPGSTAGNSGLTRSR